MRPWTTREATAEFLRVTAKTVTGLCRRGEIVCSRLGRRVLIHTPSLWRVVDHYRPELDEKKRLEHIGPRNAPAPHELTRRSITYYLPISRRMLDKLCSARVLPFERRGGRLVFNSAKVDATLLSRARVIGAAS